MIDSFKRIGEEMSKDFSKLFEIDRKKAVLNHLTIPINENYKVKDSSKPIYEIIINLNTKNKNIEFKIGEQLRKENRSKYFGFSAGSNPRGKKTYFTTNNLSYHLSNTIPDTITYIGENIKNSKHDFSNFKNFLVTIKKIFYKKSGKKFRLNKKLYVENIKDETLYLVEKLGIPKGEIKNFKIYSLHIDNKSILQTKYAKDYINLRYYHSIERFFVTEKGVKEKKYSHISGKLDNVTKNIDIPTKFYITDNAKPSMFENFNTNNSFKSFSVTQKEYMDLLLGCYFTLENLKLSFNSLWFLLIPKSENFFQSIKKNTNKLKQSIQNIQFNGAKKDQNVLKEIDRFCDRNYFFDIVFFEKGKQDFNIFKIISDISTLQIKKIEQAITNIDNGKVRRNWISWNFSLNIFWKSLYGELIKTAGKDKQKIHRSEFLDYLDIMYSNRNIAEPKIIISLLKNIKKGHFRKDFDETYLVWPAFESLLLLKELKISGGKIMSEVKKNVIALKSEAITEFFDNYSEVFGNNSSDSTEKQGLVLLGYLVNQVVWAQKSKSKERSNTFLDKINYDGFRKDRVKSFINEVIEYLKMYNTKEKQLIKFNQNIIAAMQEKLLNLEKSSLKKEEITFYILLGNFVGYQIGIQKSKEKKEANKNDNKK